MTGAVTGSAQTGFTSPTYTLSADSPIDNRSLQSAVLAIGGTQAGVAVHSVDAPFTVSVRRPSRLKTKLMATLNSITGRYSKIPANEYSILVRKAAQIDDGQWVTNEYRITSKVFAGTETYDAPNVKAGISCAIGFASQNSAGMGDTVSTGVQ